MAEKTIELEAIDPVEIYGVNDRFLERLKENFPQLKVVARGNRIMLKGDYADISHFEMAINELVAKRMKKRKLDMDDVNSVEKDVIQTNRRVTFVSDKEPVPAAKYSGDDVNDDFKSVIVYGSDGRAIYARTKNQKKLVDDYYNNDLIFALGPAGSGKTYTAIALAVRALKNKEVKRLVLTRPAVEAGEKLGFLPGDLKDKLDPYLQPLYDALIDMIQPQKLKLYMEDGTIQIAPLAYMRGRTLENAFVILDEAQNTNLGQLRMFLTRMGNHSKFIVTGDVTQIDLPNKEDSGLSKCVEIVRDIQGVAVTNFTKEDIVRHPLVGKIVKAFEAKE